MNKQEIEKAIAFIKPYAVSSGFDAAEKGYFKAAISALEAQQADRWIPVSKRLPDKVGFYICTIKWDDGSYGTHTVWWHNGIRTDRTWESNGVNVNVIAWMPLMEPWKEERP